MASTISDRALDLGVFELDNQLAGGRDVSEPVPNEASKKPAIKQVNWAHHVAEPQLEEKAR